MLSNTEILRMQKVIAEFRAMEMEYAAAAMEKFLTDILKEGGL